MEIQTLEKKINCISRLTLIHSVHITIVCPTNHPVLLGNFGERFHEIFSKNYINVWFMSYSKCWNSRRTWNLCFLFNFQLKKIRSKIIQITLIELWSFISFELRHLNSMKVSQKANFGCSIFQLKIKRKQIFQVRRQFQHFEYDMNQTLKK